MTKDGREEERDMHRLMMMLLLSTRHSATLLTWFHSQSTVL